MSCSDAVGYAARFVGLRCGVRRGPSENAVLLVVGHCRPRLQGTFAFVVSTCAWYKLELRSMARVFRRWGACEIGLPCCQRRVWHAVEL